LISHAERGRTWLWLVLVATLGVLTFGIAAAELSLALRQIAEPRELEYGEAIVYAQAGRMLRGEPLYQALDGPPYTVAAYPPVFYAVAAALQSTFGVGFGPGRVVSTLAALVTACLVAWMATRATGGVHYGLIAALLFVALGFPGRPPWYALYKEDLLGVALSFAAIAVLLSGAGSRRRLVVAGALAAGALLTKQTFVAATVAGAIWLWRRERSQAGVFLGAWAVVAVGGWGLCQLLMPGFADNTVLGNVVPFSDDALFNNLRLLLTFLGATIAVTLGWLLIRIGAGRAIGADLIVLYWGASFLPLIGLAKIGSNHNYWIELAATTSVLAAVALADAGRRWRRYGDERALVPVVLVLAGAVWAAHFLGLPAMPTPESSAGLDEVVNRVRAEPGPVLAQPLDVVALAGRDIVLEPYLFSILATEGRWDPGPLVQRICAHEIGLAVLGNPLDAPGPSYQGYTFWPAPILDALRASMVLDSVRAGRFLYVPARESTPGQATPVCSGQSRSVRG
jgi:hypothetical protein